MTFRTMFTPIFKFPGCRPCEPGGDVSPYSILQDSLDRRAVVPFITHLHLYPVASRIQLQSKRTAPGVCKRVYKITMAKCIIVLNGGNATHTVQHCILTAQCLR